MKGGNAMETNQNKKIAMEIIEQLGGSRRVMVMTGTKQFYVMKNGVGFKLGRKAVKITLNGLDYYNVEIGHMRKCQYIIDKATDNISCEQLKSCIEEMTGVYLSL